VKKQEERRRETSPDMGSKERRIKEIKEEQSKYGDIDQMWGPK